MWPLQKSQIQFSSKFLMFCFIVKHPSRGVIENGFFNNTFRLAASALWITALKCIFKAEFSKFELIFARTNFRNKFFRKKDNFREI